MVPDGQLSQNLPNPVRTLAAILHYQLKNETGIKITITATSKLLWHPGETALSSTEGSLL